jgi:hypothetical protein
MTENVPHDDLKEDQGHGKHEAPDEKVFFKVIPQFFSQKATPPMNASGFHSRQPTG